MDSMRIKRLSVLLLALMVFMGSWSVVGCSGGIASFTLTDLVISPASVQAGYGVEISATVTNGGGTGGSYTADLTVGGAAVDSQTVQVAAGTSSTIHFSYTPTADGTLDVAVGSLNGQLVVAPLDDYYSIGYKAVEGSYIVMKYSPAGMTPLHKEILFNESSGIRFTMMVNTTAVNGAREVLIPAESWVFPAFEIENLIPGIDLDLAMSLYEDSSGTLYVQENVGDVDMSSVSTSGQDPIQDNTYGDGTNDPAGSMLLPLNLFGDFETSIGQNGQMPFQIVFTTGHIDSTINTTLNKKMDGSYMESNGVPFARDGGQADYVGTGGTITTTGTGECLGIMLVGVRIYLQTEIKLVLEPVDQ